MVFREKGERRKKLACRAWETIRNREITKDEALGILMEQKRQLTKIIYALKHGGFKYEKSETDNLKKLKVINKIGGTKK